jgi:hypothetical protein
MSKLTLSVNDGVISQAKEVAKLQGTSVSEMVETYLASVVFVYKGKNSKPDAPVLRSVRGTLKHADIEDYRQHLANKYK